MADGTSRPIAEINVGDKVLAKDPVTGETGARPVTLLHANRDMELTDVTVSDRPADKATSSVGQGKGDRSTRGPTESTLHTTAHHPFWDASTGEWSDAAHLVPGKSTLIGPDGEIQYVTAVEGLTGPKVMQDLTVDDIHTYYVLAGSAPVLVHNNDPGFINLGVSGGESCPVGRGANSWTPDSADGYPSYDKAGGWLQVHGPARNYATPGGPKLNWEHVVEQSQGKQGAGRSNFPQEWINNADNIFLQDQSINFAKNGYYAKTFNWTGGKPIRDMLADMPFRQQWDFGMYVNNTLRTHGKSGLAGDM